MASQRITIAKLAGVSGEIVFERIAAWSAARNADDPSLWSPEQWPEHARHEADDFADRLRAKGFDLPVCYFVEWADMWSLGDVFTRWLTPPDCPGPIGVHANRIEIFAYCLPDGGRLTKYLADAGPQPSPESDWFVAHLQEAVIAWETLVESATLVVLRNVTGPTASDEEIAAPLQVRPPWLS